MACSKVLVSGFWSPEYMATTCSGPASRHCRKPVALPPIKVNGVVMAPYWE